MILLLNTAAIDSTNFMNEKEILDESNHIRSTTLRYGKYSNVELH